MINNSDLQQKNLNNCKLASGAGDRNRTGTIANVIEGF